MKALILVMILMFSSFTFVTIPWATADGLSPSEIEVKKRFALTFLEKIMSINVSAYVLDSSYIYVGEMYGYDQMWNLYVNLRREDENVTTDFMFIHGYMTEFRCNSTGPLDIKQGKTVVATARQVLEAYTTNLNASYCSQFIQLLDQVVLGQNQTVGIGDLVLETTENGHHLEWTYTPDGIPCRKGYGLHIPDEEHTIALLNYWDIYTIGSTEINLTREQATDTAFPLIRQYAQEKNRVITSIEAKLGYDRDWDGSRGDSYTIYPEWSVYADFLVSSNDPWVVGYFVGVWADTGQVYSSIPQCITGEPTSQPPSYLQAITIVAFVAPVTSFVLIAYKKKRRKNMRDRYVHQKAISAADDDPRVAV